MSWRGKLQLQKLTVAFCKSGGSSSGLRSFLESGQLDAFRTRNPLVEVSEHHRPGRHPCISAQYAKGGERVVDVKNKSPEEIERVVGTLRRSVGRKVQKLNRQVNTRFPSVQGTWTDSLGLIHCVTLQRRFDSEKLREGFRGS
eukprot:scaffold115_cov304-Prasinococcus_capsulatus_cf.AAC.8